MHCNKKKCEDKAYQYQSVQRFTEAVAQRCSVKKVFLEISENSQENTCARASLLIKLRVLKTSQIYLKKDVFFATFLRRLRYISKKIFILRRL